MPKISEDMLVKSFCTFIRDQCLVRAVDCHFGPDSSKFADVELALERQHWPETCCSHLLLEAKSHHSKDSANTINKIFGQLLKETGKPTLNAPRRASYHLGVLIPQDSGDWIQDNKQHRRGGGVEYYQQGFRRIDRDVFRQFGLLVKANFVLAYSVESQELDVYDWCAFYDRSEPILHVGA